MPAWTTSWHSSVPKWQWTLSSVHRTWRRTIGTRHAPPPRRASEATPSGMAKPSASEGAQPMPRRTLLVSLARVRPFDSRSQTFDRRGLGHVLIESGATHLFNAIGIAPRREGDQARLARQGESPDRLRDLKTIQLRHSNVQKHNVGLDRAHTNQPSAGAVCGRNTMAVKLENGCQRVCGILIVINHQNFFHSLLARPTAHAVKARLTPQQMFEFVGKFYDLSPDRRLGLAPLAM